MSSQASDEITEERERREESVRPAQSALTHSGSRTSNMNITSSSSSPLLLGLLVLLSVWPAAPRPSSDLSLASALRTQGGGGQSWGLKVEDEDAMEETLR